MGATIESGKYKNSRGIWALFSKEQFGYRIDLYATDTDLCQISVKPINLIARVWEQSLKRIGSWFLHVLVILIHTCHWKHAKCRSGGQHETADDMLSRAIYAMEMAWPPNFSLGECTLEYDLPENVPLFKALFQHIRVIFQTQLSALWGA